MATKVLFSRIDTAANFASLNAIYSMGELCWEQDTERAKVGDGTTAWNSLPYAFEGTAALAAHIAASDPHPQYETSAEAQAKVDAHASLTNNPHTVTKAQVGLGNVDNTSDLNKPISTATQTALNLKYDASNPSGYQTAAQVTSTVGAASTADRDRTNHTGTQLSSTISNFASTVLSTILTGISFAASTAVVATDTILVAIGKLQSQINNVISSIPSTTDGLTEGTTNLYSPFTENANGITYNDSGKGVSIGSNIPANCKLRVGSEDGDLLECLDSANNLPTAAVQTHMRRSRGTLTAPTAVQLGDAIAQISIRSHDGTAYGVVANITSVATENHTPSARGANLVFSTTPNGSTTPVNRWVVTASGGIDFLGNVLQQVGTPVNNDHAATKLYVDNGLATKANLLGGNTFSGGNQTFLDGALNPITTIVDGYTRVPTPIALLDAANKQYVDAKVFGNNYEFFVDAVTSTTTSTAQPLTAVASTFTTASVPAGTYRIGLQYHWTSNSGAADSRFALFVNGTQIENQHNEELQDATTQKNDQIITSVVLAAGTHTIELRFGSEAGITTTVNRVTAEFWRVA